MSSESNQPEPRPAFFASLGSTNPAYFAMVMATGIISMGCDLLGMRLLAIAMFAANIVFYAVLWGLLLWRVVRFRDQVIADFLDDARNVGFFTLVAATCVLGSQFRLTASAWRPAAVLWVFGILLWAGLTYAIFTIITVKHVKPTLAEGINGGWLVAVVAAQSVCVLGTQVVDGFTGARPQILLFCLALWLGGGMMYVWMISLIFYRYAFFSLSPADLTPPYWINMGAAAISTLAGTTLITVAPHSPLLSEMVPFLKGLTLFFWATASWWIPMLIILGIWRHVYWRFPLAYDAMYWGAVFPLGMYTVCTLDLARALNVPFLVIIPEISIYVALAAWALTALGLVRALLAVARSNGKADPQA